MKQIIIFLVLFCCVAAITNPSKTEHKDALKEAVSEHGLMLSLVTNIVGDYVPIQYESRFILSKTYILVDGKRELLSIGILNHVFVAPGLKHKQDTKHFVSELH